MSLELTKPADVADLFVDTCKRLRDMGATRVEAFGLVACFAPQQPAVEPRKDEKPEEPVQLLGPEAQAIADRAKRLAEGRG